MRETLKKNISLVLVFALIISVCCLFSFRKAGMFVDEIYCYGLSNGYYTPFVKSIPDGEMRDCIISHQELFDYLTVGDDDRFAFGSVYYNQTQDVHPPLYYWLFNIASSLTPGVLSKWTGLVLDFIIYMLTLVMLYLLSQKLFRSSWVSVAAVAVYGLSSIGMSTMIMIRMYVLLTLLTVILAYLVACLIESPSNRYYPLITLTMLAGLFTQYYYVFYAFFLCAAYDIFALVKKRYRSFFAFSAWAIAGVVLLVVFYPACLTQLFADALVSGGNAVENLTTISQYSGRLRIFVGGMRHGLKAAVLIGIACAIACLILAKKIISACKEGKIRFSALIIILPAFLTFVLVAIISPVSEMRYVYNIVPMFVLAVCFLLHLLDCSVEKFQTAVLPGQLLLLAAALLSLWMVRTIPPEYLYPEQAEYNLLVSEYAHNPCVYFSEFNGPVTQDLLQLVAFDDFMITNDTASKALAQYIESHDNSDALVVYVDVSGYWGSGYDADEMTQSLIEHSDYSQAQRLYQYGLSDTYVLTK